ncbi:hypothetical protein [Halorhabdus amylolytica]|uniref:hypothetical protein n=1 Tax=Halorhabdus amylolytica TaxID=2559573 RepID=UPI0010AAE64B|nr:hypothetical protein [Halorhabdus amylolytica]
MPIYDRGAATDPAIIDRFDGGVGWIAHPDEAGRRASHAIRGEEGVWLFDPLEAPGVEDLLADLGDVVGVAVCSNWHTRDADIFADRFDVPIFVPEWMDRVPEKVDAPVDSYDRELAESGFIVDPVDPLPGWREGVAYRESDGTLYTPDLLSTRWTVGSERVTLTLPCRFFPPRDLLGDLEPNRILVGHGEGIQENATGALANTLDGARKRLPRSIIEQGPGLAVGIAAAMW